MRNEVWAKLHTDDPGVIEATYRLLRFRPEGYYFMPRYRAGKWDGYISLYKRRDGTFPGGLVARTAACLQELGVGVRVENRADDPWAEPQLADGTNSREMRDYQDDAVARALHRKRGVFEAATGLGKTEIMGEVIRRLGCRSLIIVASQVLAWQTIERFQETLEFPHADLDGLYGIVGDNIDSPGLITAALYQTLHRRLMPVCLRCGNMGELGQETCARRKHPRVGRPCGGELDYTESVQTEEWLASFDSIHLDEGHRAPAATWWPIVQACPAYWRFAYSATPFKSDKVTELKLVGATGEVLYSFKAREAIAKRWLTEPFVAMIDSQFPALWAEDTPYIDVYREGIVEHEHRNRLIADIAAITSRDWGVPTLILVQWIEHGENIRRSLRQLGLKVDFLSGRDSTEARRAALKALNDGEKQCLISTTIFDEGVDAPEIGALILAGGGKAKHKVLQRIGRGLRVAPGKEYLAVFDFWDSHSDEHLLGHSRQRLRAVKEAGFAHEILTSQEILARMVSGDIRSGSGTDR